MSDPVGVALDSALSFSNVVNPFAIQADGAGNLYIVESDVAGDRATAILKETWTGSDFAQSTISNTGLNFPVDIAIDGAGNAYVADQEAFQILKEAPTSGG